MRSVINNDFVESYRKLPKTVREQARKAYRLFRDNPRHPSLNFKKIHVSEPIYSARVSRGYRALGVIDDDVVIWFWIGSHADYDKLFDSL